MNPTTNLTLSTSPQTQPARNPRRIASLALRQRHLDGRPRRNNTGKELDSETGLYYYGARYLDPRVSRWLSGDPAMGEYVPSAPTSEEARRRNENLPGMGGVFNCVNLHAYHYAGNNPVVMKDPNGEYLINNVAEGARSAHEFAQRPASIFDISRNYFDGFIGAYVFVPNINSDRPSFIGGGRLAGIELPNNMNRSLTTAIAAKNNELSTVKSKITANAVPMENGRYEVQVTVSISDFIDKTETIAFSGAGEIMTDGIVDQTKVDKIANDTINIVLGQNRNTQNIERRE